VDTGNAASTALGLDTYTTSTNGDLDAGTVDMGYHYLQGAPTAVELVYMTATGHADRVDLNWKTASELNTAGFHIWRCRKIATGETEFIRITDQIIPAQGGPTYGAEYAYKDTDVVTGYKYFYRLEDVDYIGDSTMFRPISAYCRGD